MRRSRARLSMSCADPPRPCASTAASRARSGSGPKRRTDWPACGSSGGAECSSSYCAWSFTLTSRSSLVAHVGHGHFLAHLPALEREREVGARADRPAVDRDDDVAGQRPGRGCRGAAGAGRPGRRARPPRPARTSRLRCRRAAPRRPPAGRCRAPDARCGPSAISCGTAHDTVSTGIAKPMPADAPLGL